MWMLWPCREVGAEEGKGKAKEKGGRKGGGSV